MPEDFKWDNDLVSEAIESGLTPADFIKEKTRAVTREEKIADKHFNDFLLKIEGTRLAAELLTEWEKYKRKTF